MTSLRTIDTDLKRKTELLQWQEIDNSLENLHNQFNDKKANPSLTAHNIEQQIEKLLAIPFSKLKLDDLNKVIEKIEKCSLQLSKSQGTLSDAIKFIDLAIRIIYQYDQNQKTLIQKYKIIAIEFIGMQIRNAPIDYRLSYSVSQDRAKIISRIPNYLMVYFIYIHSKKPSFSLFSDNIYFDTVFETAMIYRNKSVIKSILLCSSIKDVKTIIDRYSKDLGDYSTRRECILESKAELDRSLQSAAYLLKVNDKTRTIPFFLKFTALDEKGDRKPKTISSVIQKFIFLGALDSDFRGYDEDFLMKKITETRITPPTIVEKKEEPATYSLFKKTNDDLLSLDNIANAAILNFGLEWGRGKDGAQNSVLLVHQEVFILKSMLKAILWDMLREEKTDKIFAFLVKAYLSKLGQEKQYPEKSKVKEGLKKFIDNFNTKITKICEQAAMSFSGKHNAQLLDKSLHNLSLKVGAAFASNEFFDNLNDPKIINQFVINLSELLSKKFALAKTELAKSKAMESKEKHIDPHTERNNPELFVVKFIADDEIAFLIRGSISPAPTTICPDLSSETLRILM